MTERELAYSRAVAAEKTLCEMGYTYGGGELWSPPLGKEPNWGLVEEWQHEAQKYKARAAALAKMLEAIVKVNTADFKGWKERRMV
jgi:hypothetical protein